MSAETIRQLKQYTSCDAADALIKLGEPHGGFLPGLSMYSPHRQAGEEAIVGPAYTVEYAFLEDERPKLENHYIDGVPEGAVIYISSPDVPNAVYGGLMSTCAQARGAVGTVVHGRIRDLNEHRQLGYAVFAKDVGTTAPQELLKPVSTNTPLLHPTGYNDTSQTVRPGDIIVADLNGVVRIPAALADEVVRLIPAQVAADEGMAEAIKGGMGFAEASRRFRGK